MAELTDQQLTDAERSIDAHLASPYWHGTIKALLAEVRTVRAARASPPPDPAQDPETRRQKAERLAVLLENRMWDLARCPDRKRGGKEAADLRARLLAARAALLDYVCGAERKEKEAPDNG